jgi:hypothetical protein
MEDGPTVGVGVSAGEWLASGGGAWLVFMVVSEEVGSSILEVAELRAAVVVNKGSHKRAVGTSTKMK